MATSAAWRGPTRQSRLFGAPPPLIFFGGKSLVALVGKPRAQVRRENEAACTIRPREAGEGDHWSSRSERTVVEGAQDSKLRFRCRRFSSHEEASERKCWNITKTLAARCVLRPLHHPFGVVPLPRYRGGG